MRKFILLLISLTLFLYGKTQNRLYLFANYSGNQIELKWFLKNYESNYIFKIYRAKKGEKPKLIATIKPSSLSQLKRAGYDKDYIFMIYPFKDAKNINQQISILKIQPKVSVFRILRAIQENSFAKNLGHYFIDKMIKKNSLYLYKIVAYKNGKKAMIRMIIVSTKKFPKESDIMWAMAKSIPQGIAISWDTKDDFAFYNIYRKLKDEKNFKKLNKLPLYISKSFAQKAKYLYVDKNIKESQFASYYIKKLNMFSKEGKPSKIIKIKYSIKKSVPRVKQFFLTTTKNGVILRWRKVKNALGYNIYKSPTYTGRYYKINKKPLKKEFFLDKYYKPSKSSYYFVTALNLKGESKPSIIMMAFSKDITPPKKPTGLKAKTAPGEVKLSWKQNKEKDLAGYRVYVSMDMDKKEWSLVNKKLIRTNRFIHKRAKTLSRFPYYYRVSAVDTTLNESLPSKIIKVKLPDVTPPKQPVLKGYKTYAKKIILQWTQVITYDFDHYNIYRKVGKKWKKLNKKPLLKSYFEDRSAKTGKNIYTITAVDTSKNESKIKKVYSVIMTDKIPPKIENFAVKKVKKGILVSFDCKDKDYNGFEVYRSSGDILHYFNASNFIKNKKSFLDKNIAKKAHYFYMIVAYDKNANATKSKVIDIKLKGKKK